jgi:hypothetical protein
MQWPEELFTLLARGLTVKPYKGVTPRQVYQALLDDTARRAVWRAQCKPESLGDCLRWPYTPLGSASIELGRDRAEMLKFDGSHWGKAVDAIHSYMEEHAREICEAFQDEQEPYDDLSGRFTTE